MVSPGMKHLSPHICSLLQITLQMDLHPRMVCSLHTQPLWRMRHPRKEEDMKASFAPIALGVLLLGWTGLADAGAADKSPGKSGAQDLTKGLG